MMLFVLSTLEGQVLILAILSLISKIKNSFLVRRLYIMNLKPLGDRLIVEPIEQEEQSTSGIILPETAKEKPMQGKVLAAGPSQPIGQIF